MTNPNPSKKKTRQDAARAKGDTRARELIDQIDEELKALEEEVREEEGGDRFIDRVYRILALP